MGGAAGPPEQAALLPAVLYSTGSTGIKKQRGSQQVSVCCLDTVSAASRTGRN